MTLKEMILSMNLLQICYAFFVINVVMISITIIAKILYITVKLFQLSTELEHTVPGMFKTGLLKVESVFAAVLYLIPPCAVLGTVVWNMFVRVF